MWVLAHGACHLGSNCFGSAKQPDQWQKLRKSRICTYAVKMGELNCTFLVLCSVGEGKLEPATRKSFEGYRERNTFQEISVSRVGT